jgi:hypothetical protein
MSNKKGNTNSGEHDWIELQTFKRSGPRDPKEVKFVELVRAKSDDDETELERPFPPKKKFSKTAERADLSNWMSGSEHAFNNRIRRQLRDQRKKELHAFVNANPEIKEKFIPGLTRNKYNQLKAEALALMATLEAEDSSSSSSIASSGSSMLSSNQPEGLFNTNAPMNAEEFDAYKRALLESTRTGILTIPSRSSNYYSGRGIQSRKNRKRSRKHGKGTRRYGKLIRNNTKLKRRKTNKRKHRKTKR